MKTKLLTTIMSFMLVFNATYAVNTVRSTNNAAQLELNQTSKVEKKEGKKAIEKKNAFKFIKKIKKSLSDTDTVILVILSLFPILALVAIYLKDGKSITMNFWIDLILHFIALYWLFAILVVLDVINLA